MSLYILPMRTVQMTLDADLVSRVDKAARKLGMSRSAFAREALRAALERAHVRELEKRHKAGYEKRPVRKGELDWSGEQVWPE